MGFNSGFKGLTIKLQIVTQFTCLPLQRARCKSVVHLIKQSAGCDVSLLEIVLPNFSVARLATLQRSFCHTQRPLSAVRLQNLIFSTMRPSLL